MGVQPCMEWIPIKKIKKGQVVVSEFSNYTPSTSDFYRIVSFFILLMFYQFLMFKGKVYIF